MTLRVEQLLRLSKDEKRQLSVQAVLGLLGSTAISLAVHSWLFWSVPEELFAQAMLAALLLPVVLTGPLIVYILLRLRHLLTLNSELRTYAGTDSLTQLPNRGAFTRAVDAKLAEMDGCAITRGAFLVIDADHFKHVNDHWGHSTGDLALAKIASAMRAVISQDDAIGRLGGEEFGVFLNGSSPQSSRRLAEKLRTLVEAIDLRSDGDDPIRLSISIGVVQFCEVMSFAALYKMADGKLYEAKAKGRNRVEFEELGIGFRRELAA